jgi:hypothetical protein
MTHQCNKGHHNLKRSTTLIPGQTVNHCPACGSYNVEGSEFWPIGELSDPGVQRWLCQFSDDVQNEKNKRAEFLDAPIDDPRIEVIEW